MFLRSSIQRIVCCVRSKKRDAEQRQTGTSCAAACYLIQSHEATLFIKFHVLWLERHSRRTVRLSLLRGLRDDVLYCSLSLSLSLVTTVLCPWCWLRENTTNSSLSIAHFVAGCVLVRSPSPYRPHYSGSPVQKRGSVDSATTKGYSQKGTENYAGNLEPHPFGWQPWGYVLQHMTLSLTSSPDLWLPGAF